MLLVLRYTTNGPLCTGMPRDTLETKYEKMMSFKKKSEERSALVAARMVPVSRLLECQ